MGDEARLRLAGAPAQEGLAKFLHHLAFSPDPVAQRASGTAAVGEPEFVRPLLDVCLRPQMLFRSQDHGGGKMRVDQLDGLFVSIPLRRVGSAVEPRGPGGFPAGAALDRVELRFPGRTSIPELSEPWMFGTFSGASGL